MVETLTGSNRSAGQSYDETLARDTHPVRPIMRENSPLPPGPTKVKASKYYSKEYHDLEVERLWKKVWQLACHEDEIPGVGDYIVYEVASLSFIVARTAPDEIKAFWNVCLHRGRKLREFDGKGQHDFRCSFHGWNWSLEGRLKEVPCQWDFPTVKSGDYDLPQARVGRWGGLVFINPDAGCPTSLEEHLGRLPEFFTHLPYERRYKKLHVAKVLACNWKVAQEAFMESYHVLATHPTLLMQGFGDAQSKYDVFGNVSRAMSAKYVGSAHVDYSRIAEPIEGGRAFTKLRHPISRAVYERVNEGEVLVTAPDGKTGVFDDWGRYISGEVRHADAPLCNWVGGRQLPGAEALPEVHIDLTAQPRATEAAGVREELRQVLGDRVDAISDAELIDPIFYSVFPNWSPWGSFNPINYRFRPNGDDPDSCIHEVFFFAPVPEGQPRPAPAPMQWLDLEDDYTQAVGLGLLAKVFNQDVVNVPQVQKGLKAMKKGEIILADYEETKIRHFHQLLDKWVGDW